MKEQFKEHKFSKRVLQRIDLANSILESYARQGYSVTLRSLYYQLVVRNDIENSLQSYKRLVDTLSKARLAGLIDWKSFEDLERPLQGGYGGYDSPHQYFSDLENGYFRDRWEGQENYVEVWVEKNAQLGVISQPCNRLRVRYMSCKGYLSQTAQYEAGKRMQRMARQGRTCHVLHLGDHDPSGIDMTRDNDERLDMFAQGHGVNLTRIALHMHQIEELNLPHNPAKMTDSRIGGYVARFGKKSWELDALEPSYTDALITRHIEELIDTATLNNVIQREREEAEEVDETARALGEHYDEIRAIMRDNDWI